MIKIDFYAKFIGIYNARFPGKPKHLRTTFFLNREKVFQQIVSYIRFTGKWTWKAK